MEKLLIFLIKFCFPLLLITDYTSIILSNELLLNISRFLRSFILLLFIIENFRLRSIIKKFYFYKFFLFFAFVLFLYVFTDRNIAEGFWMYFRFLFWVLGINVLFAYAYKGIFQFQDFIKVIKVVALTAFIFTVYYFVSGYIKDDYNVAAYLVLSLYPIILYSSKSFTKNRLIIILCMLSIFVTVKRGAVIAFSIATLFYYLGGLAATFSVKKLFGGLVLISLFAFSALYVIEQQEDRLDDRLSAEQFDVNNDRAGSGRVGMYSKIYESWYNSDDLIFGFGNQADSYRKRGKRTHAHSDIFGFLYNFGLIGITLIVLLYRKIILFYFKIKRRDKSNAFIVLAFFAILFLVNLYSGLFYITETIYLFSLLPYLQIKAMKNSMLIDGK